MDTINEPARVKPVRAEVDVLIIEEVATGITDAGAAAR